MLLVFNLDKCKAFYKTSRMRGLASSWSQYSILRGIFQIIVLVESDVAWFVTWDDAESWIVESLFFSFFLIVIDTF